jgi:hypothetical protein
LDKEAFHIKENSWVAKLAAKKLGTKNVAIVIGATIHLHNTTKEDFLKNEAWVKHEKCHLRQFRRYGFFRFIFLYLWESMRRGYYHNRFEAEARAAEIS